MKQRSKLAARSFWRINFNERHGRHIAKAFYGCQKGKERNVTSALGEQSQSYSEHPIDLALSRSTAEEWMASNQRCPDPFQWVINFRKWANTERCTHWWRHSLFLHLEGFEDKCDIQDAFNKLLFLFQQCSFFQRTGMYWSYSRKLVFYEMVKWFKGSLCFVLFLLQDLLWDLLQH